VAADAESTLRRHSLRLKAKIRGFAELFGPGQTL
jgi:hypothetical protein